jgi:hypothetical protein
MSMVCVHKVFVKPLSYGPMIRGSVQKVFVNPLSYGPMTMICVHKVFVKPFIYVVFRQVHCLEVCQGFANTVDRDTCHGTAWQWFYKYFVDTDHCHGTVCHRSPWTGFKFITLVVIGTDCICSCKSNYHTMMTTIRCLLYFLNRIV